MTQIHICHPILFKKTSTAFPIPNAQIPIPCPHTLPSLKSECIVWLVAYLRDCQPVQSPVLLEGICGFLFTCDSHLGTLPIGAHLKWNLLEALLCHPGYTDLVPAGSSDSQRRFFSSLHTVTNTHISLLCVLLQSVCFLFALFQIMEPLTLPIFSRVLLSDPSFFISKWYIE